jgi:WD40 repeat protein
VVFDENVAVTGGRDGSIHGWDLRTNDRIFKGTVHNDMVWAVQMYQNTLLSSGFDGLVNVRDCASVLCCRVELKVYVQVWDLRKVEVVRSLDHGAGVQVRALAFDMSRIVSGDTNGDIKVRHVELGMTTVVSQSELQVWSWDNKYNYTVSNMHQRYVSSVFLAPHFMVRASDGHARTI